MKNIVLCCAAVEVTIKAGCGDRKEKSIVLLGPQVKYEQINGRHRIAGATGSTRGLLN
jgi:cellobiose-specific phosphotransferase system component IIB